jgi:inner membrane protein
MQKILIYKFLAVAGFVLLLLIPLSMIGGVISERESYRDGVIKDISKSWTGQQKITGAILVSPYKEMVENEVDIYENGTKKTIFKKNTLQKYKYFLPEVIAIDGNITTTERYRGIYKVPVYLASLKLEGHFKIPKSLGITENITNITWQRPYIVFGVQDIRGISRSVKLHINKQNIPLLPGTHTSVIEQGMHAFLKAEYHKEQHLAFDIALELQGMEKISFLPTGKFTKVNLSSPWPHPSFVGRFLPQTREITDKGFTASWEISFLASNTLQHLLNCTQKDECKEFENNIFGVSLHQGVDIYLQTERSIKYALLFIGLTFVAFFIFEILKGSPIHAVQYGLVGMALALFYLLLISLSEHVSFCMSYIIASSACVSLLAFYMSYVLRSVKGGFSLGFMLGVLYGLLYLLIGSEDYALLMGSVLLFVVLAIIMMITRKIDWYRIEENSKKN